MFCIMATSDSGISSRGSKWELKPNETLSQTGFVYFICSPIMHFTEPIPCNAPQRQRSFQPAHIHYTADDLDLTVILSLGCRLFTIEMSSVQPLQCDHWTLWGPGAYRRSMIQGCFSCRQGIEGCSLNSSAKGTLPRSLRDFIGPAIRSLGPIKMNGSLP